MEVVAAIIIYNEKILCVQRNINKFDYLSLKYEFPGGKVELGETKEIALVREIKEELNMEIEIIDNFLIVNHEYPDFNLNLNSFICKCHVTDLTLTEHVNYKWLSKDKLMDLDWAAADLPIVEKLRNS